MPRYSRFRFLSWFSFHQAPEYQVRIPLGLFPNFRKFCEIYLAQGAQLVSFTSMANGKIFNQKSFKYLVWTPLGSRVNVSWHHCTGGKFSAGLRISSRIFKIICDPDVIFRGLEEDNSWKNLKQKILWHCPFKHSMVSWPCIGIVKSPVLVRYFGDWIFFTNSQTRVLNCI